MTVMTPIAGPLQTGDRRVRPRLGLRHGTPLASQGVPGATVCFSYGSDFQWSIVRAQSCPTLCSPIDFNLPGSSVYGISHSGFELESPVLAGGTLPLTPHGKPSIQQRTPIVSVKRVSMIYSVIKVRGKLFTPMGRYCQNTRLSGKKE